MITRSHDFGDDQVVFTHQRQPGIVNANVKSHEEKTSFFLKKGKLATANHSLSRRWRSFKLNLRKKKSAMRTEMMSGKSRFKNTLSTN